jgi:hypothetical protein
MRQASACIAIVAAAIALPSPPAGAAGTQPAAEMPYRADAPYRLEYRVDYGNLRLIEARVTLDFKPDRYEIVGSGIALGPLAWMSDWKGSARTVGRIDGGRLLPELHENSGNWRGEGRHAMLKYLGLDNIKVLADPPPDPAKVTAVPPEAIPGTVDPLSATLNMLANVARTGSCAGTARIFDGRRRYDLEVTDRGTTTLPADRPWDFRGPARECAMKSKPIGGFWRDEDPPSDEDRVIWLAPLDQGLWIPVRLEFPATIGTVIGRAVRPGADVGG